MNQIVTNREREKIQRIQKILMAKRIASPVKQPSTLKQISAVPSQPPAPNTQQRIISGRSGVIKKTINQNQRITEQARNARPATVGRSTPINEKVIFLSGGIGDVLTVESFMPEMRKKYLETILYGTRKHLVIQELFQALPNYPNLKEHRVVWSDFTNFWCFLYKTECENRYVKQGAIPPAILAAAEDYGIAIKFPVIKSGQWPFVGSSFIKHQVANIDRLNLPQNYIVIAPYSSDKANSRRDFTSADWEATITMLRRRGAKGVVVNNGTDFVPNSDQLINLSNKTTILESIEATKKASAYIGIDTCFSVLAAQLFQSSNLIIKCVNNHGLNNKAVYFAPHNTFEFIVDAVSGRTI